MASPGLERARRATVLFARAPEDEQRAKPLGPDPVARAHVHAAGLHRKLLERTLAAAAGVADTDVYLVTTGDLACARETALREVQASRLVVLPQIGDTFRERFEAAVSQAFDQGHDHVVVIGSDTPELGTAELREAFCRLEQEARTGTHAVLGPATDGGYYLLGLSALSRAPFVDIAFGGPRVAVDTITALERAGFTVSLLAPLRDIDDLADVGAAAQRLQARGRPEDASLLVLLLSVLAAQVTLPPWHLPHARSLVELLPRDCRGPPSA